MKLNTKTRYGLRAILEIAINTEDQGVFQKDIAKSQSISVKYLDQIIAELKSAELITTMGGKKSGYQLNRDAASITIYDVFKAFNPPLKLIECFDQEHECSKHNNCVSQTFWCELNKKIIAHLQEKTVADLAQEHKQLNNTSQFMFYI
jgi:Rrf2 family protein